MVYVLCKKPSSFSEVLHRAMPLVAHPPTAVGDRHLYFKRESLHKDYKMIPRLNPKFSPY